MVEQNRNVFLQTLIVTIIIFIIGLVLGFALESNRVDRTELALLNSEINLLDEQVRNLNIGVFNISCDLSTRSTFDFADRIYQEALELEKFDSSSKFTNELATIHKQYDLLRGILWARGIEIKENCAGDFHTIVYLFEYSSEDLNTQARQSSISRLLTDLKNQHGDTILLIPIAANLDLESVRLIKDTYEISELPAIIIDEEKVVSKDTTYSELENIVFENPGFEELEGFLFQTKNLKSK